MSSWEIGEVRHAQGSGAKPYDLKNCDGRVFSCNCPAWRNQGGKKPDVRTCKHLKAERGAAVEEARIAANAGGSPPAAPAALSLVVLTKAGGLPWTDAVFPNEKVPVFSSTADAEARVSELRAADDPMWQTAELKICSEAEARSLKSARSAPGAASPDPSRALLAGNPWETPEEDRARIVAAKELQLGRKLRQDEKTALFGPPVLLANDWWDVEGHDPTGWWMSEKLDGVRAYWDGKDFVSRQGNVFNAPAWFKAIMPSHPLDGELWMGRKMFQKTISVVKTTTPDERWRDVKYVVFDAPHMNEAFETRLMCVEEATLVPQILPAVKRSPHLVFHEQIPCRGEEHLIQELERLTALGAEGIMLRQPGSAYVKGRSSTLLKVKSFKDAEATVVGHEPGKKQHKGKCGGLVLQMPDGKTFNVNAGAEAVRLNPPPVGTRVTYRYTELTDGGIPKCASFVRVRPEE